MTEYSKYLKFLLKIYSHLQSKNDMQDFGRLLLYNECFFVNYNRTEKINVLFTLLKILREISLHFVYLLYLCAYVGVSVHVFIAWRTF